MDDTVHRPETTYTIAHTWTDCSRTQEEQLSETSFVMFATELADPPQQSFVNSFLAQTQTDTENDKERSREDQAEGVVQPPFEIEGARQANALVAESVQRLVEKHNLGKRWKDGWADTFRAILSQTERMPKVILDTVRAYRKDTVEAYEKELVVVAECRLDELLDMSSSPGNSEAACYLWYTEQVLSAYCETNAEFMATFIPSDAGPLLRSRLRVVAWLDEVAESVDSLREVADKD